VASLKAEAASDLRGIDFLPCDLIFQTLVLQSIGRTGPTQETPGHVAQLDVQRF
jgi:hypothetical protein